MRRIADLAEHPVSITTRCDCTEVRCVPYGWLLDTFGPEATIEEAERRMICKICGERFALQVKAQWAYSGGRDRRLDPPPMPSWVDRK